MVNSISSILLRSTPIGDIRVCGRLWLAPFKWVPPPWDLYIMFVHTKQMIFEFCCKPGWNGNDFVWWEEVLVVFFCLVFWFSFLCRERYIRKEKLNLVHAHFQAISLLLFHLSLSLCGCCCSFFVTCVQIVSVLFRFVFCNGWIPDFLLSTVYFRFACFFSSFSALSTSNLALSSSTFYSV